MYNLSTVIARETRTTRTPEFWGYPPPPHDYPYHWVILDPKSKEDKVKFTNLKNSPKFHNEYSWRYRADTILSTDRQTDKVMPVYPPFNFVEAEGIIKHSAWKQFWTISSKGKKIVTDLNSQMKKYWPFFTGLNKEKNCQAWEKLMFWMPTKFEIFTLLKKKE